MIGFLSVVYLMQKNLYLKQCQPFLIKSTLPKKFLNNGKFPKLTQFIKGAKTAIENYHPIANLCSASKIFEKLILKKIHYLETINKLDLTGKQQHGFKRNKSTATVGTLLQFI